VTRGRALTSNTSGRATLLATDDGQDGPQLIARAAADPVTAGWLPPPKRRSDAGREGRLAAFAWMTLGGYAPTAAARTSGGSRLTLTARMALAVSVSGLGRSTRGVWRSLSQGVGPSVTHEAIEAWMGLVPGESGCRRALLFGLGVTAHDAHPLTQTSDLTGRALTAA
jgi:hypothetical protein